MAKTSLLPDAGPFTGTETVPFVQDGVLKKGPLAGIVDAITGEAQAAAAAAAASAAALAPLGWAYYTGDRSASITVRATPGLIATGTAQNLVNGSTAGNNSTAAFVFTNGVAVADKVITLDFGLGAEEIPRNMKWYQTAAQTHGQWQMRVSNVGTLQDDGSVTGAVWTNVGAEFTLGGNALQVIAAMAANSIDCRFLQFLGKSGTANGGPFIYELEIERALTMTNQRLKIPTGPKNGQTPLYDKKTKSIVWENLPLMIPAVPLGGANVVAEYRFDRFDAVLKTEVRDKVGANHIDFGATHQATYGAPPIFTPRGIRCTKNMIRVPSMTLRTIGVLMRGEVNNTSLYEIGVSTAGEPIYVQGSTLNSLMTVRVMTANGTIVPLAHQSGVSADRCNAGGWVIRFYQAAASFTGLVGFGGHPTQTAATNRSRDVEFAAARFYDGPLTDADCLSEALDFFVPLGESRGIHTRKQGCSLIIKGAAALGQSMIVGNPKLDYIEADKKDLLRVVQELHFWSACKGTGTGINVPFVRSFARQFLAVGVNNWLDDRTTGSSKHFGIEVGWALAMLEGFDTATGPEAFLKSGMNGTFLAGPASGVGGNSMHPDMPKNSGYYWRIFMKSLWRFEQAMMNIGIGIDWRVLLFDQGQQECGIANPAAYSLGRQADLQAVIDTTKRELGYATGSAFRMVIAPVHPNAAPAAYDPAYIANVNNGTDAFIAANNAAAGYVEADKIAVADLPLTAAPTVGNTIIDGLTYPPINPAELVDGLHYPAIAQQVHARRMRTKALALGY